MIAALLLATLTAAPAPVADSLLATVPQDAYVLAHCRDTAGLRARVERNDWYRLLGSSHGAPLWDGLARDIGRATQSEVDELLEIAAGLEGEAVLFDTGIVAGFVTDPPADPAGRQLLADRVRAWLPAGEAAERHSLDLAGGTVELVAWPDEPGEFGAYAGGRAGHFAAFVDHPRALAVYSGDDSAAVVAAITEGFTAFGEERTAPLVASYVAAGGGAGAGLELYVDFTPLIQSARKAWERAAQNMFPDPVRFVGLEEGTWLHATADVFPGSRVDCQARLHLPPDSLSARLADTFQALPHSLPADLPHGVWGLWALNWDLRSFYDRARTAYEESGAPGMEVVDAGIVGAKGASGVDPIEDVLNQLAGDFAFYFVDPPTQADGGQDADGDVLRTSDVELACLGFHAGLADGEAFLTAFEKLADLEGADDVFESTEIAGVDAYVVAFDDDLDGGMAFLSDAFAIAPTRRVLERSVRALSGDSEASLLDGSRMQAAIDENAGACFLTCVEMTPLRVYLLPHLGDDIGLPPLEAGQPARDPFDSQLLGSARRTRDGFEFRLQTR